MARNRTITYLPLSLLGVLGACAGSPERTLYVQEGAAPEPRETGTQPPVEQVAGEVDSAAPPAGAEDQTICRNEVVTGTHRPTRVCMTSAQRRAMREAAQDWYRSGGRDGGVSQIPVVR